MKINTCTNKHFLKKIEVFIRIRQFLDVYRQSYKSHNFLKIRMFSNKIFTFSSSAQLFEKVNISHKISIFFPKINVFAQKLMLRKTLVTLLQSLHSIILSLYLKIHSFTQKLTLFA